MAAKFPTSVPSFPAREALQPIFPQHVNALQDEVTAIAATLIATPANVRRAPLVIQGANPQIVLDDSGANLIKARLVQQAGGASVLGTNTIWTGGAWGVDDVGQRSSMLVLDPAAERLHYYTAPGGAASPAWALAFSVDSYGLQYERGRARAIGEWAAYTPSWQSSGVNSALGNGTLTGEYTVIGKTVYARIKLTLGSTSTQGTGFWFFSVPPGYPMPGSLMDNVGQARLALGTNFLASAFWANVNAVGLVAENTSALVGAGVPWTWSTGGTCTLWLTYETP